MPLKIVYQAASGEFEKAMADIYRPIAEAGTAAMDDAVTIIKTQGRADIASAGFGRRWQNTFRVDRYPKRGVSANAAALIYHRIPYADIFETGGDIRAKSGKLWIPLKNTPKKIGRNRMRPRVFQREVGGLFSLQIRGKPYLAAKIEVSARQAATGRVPKPSLAKLRNGATTKGITRAVPLFVGVDSVKIRDRFSLREITQRAADQLGALYLKNLRADE